MSRYTSHEQRLNAFMARAKHDPSTGCWEWQGEIKQDGYTECWAFGKREMAHRAAYRELVGPIPEGLVVRHTCDNKRCCNPAHLLIGTQADNIADKVARDRQAKGVRHGMARLTEDEVRTIKNRAFSRGYLSEKFNIHRTYVDAIRRGKVWSHVE